MISQACSPPVECSYNTIASDKPIPVNDILYMGKEDDVFVTEEDLPNGIHPVFFHLSTGRGIEGKYTHSAVSIGFFLKFRQNEKDTNFMISRGGVGCLYIEDHKIQSLTIQKDILDRLQKGDTQEILIRIGSVFKAIDHKYSIRFYTSEEEYKEYSSRIIPALKNYGLLN